MGNTVSDKYKRGRHHSIIENNLSAGLLCKWTHNFIVIDKEYRGKGLSSLVILKE